MIRRAAARWHRHVRDGLYVRHVGLWLIDPFSSGGPARIVQSLFKGSWPNSYYYPDWRDQFAWFSQGRSARPAQGRLP
jgi:hypothetical protein